MAEDRKIVVPGETIIQGESYLPGEGARREGDDIVAGRFGLADISDRLVKVIPLSGAYAPRKGNNVIGQVVDITFNGWLININAAANAFLMLSEFPKFVNKDELQDALDFGDLISAKVFGVKAKGIDISARGRGLGKLEGGMIIRINPSKVPRVIGKEGSMVNVIKDETGCDINVGQNGIVWVRGENVESELKAKKIVEFVCEHSFVSGLTEKVKEFIDNLK